jgi:soluble lytic murein transglycosylase-like protein
MIVVRQGSAWPSLAFLCLCVLLLAAVVLAHQVVRALDSKDQMAAAGLARAERKIQQLEAGIDFDSRRRQLLLGMRNHILKVNRRIGVGDAYQFAEFALVASEKYPAVDPLLLLAIGVVESGYDPGAKSPADARGLYQIWPSTGRVLSRALGWSYDEATLYDPEKNTEAAALYLEVLFATYADPQMVLAEYNGGPLNAGYFRAGVGQLAAETRNYVPRVMALHRQLQEEFERGIDPRATPAPREAGSEARALEPPRRAPPGPTRPEPPSGGAARRGSPANGSN